MCDHDDDCGDGSDEPHNCTYAACSATTQFKCDNLRCIPLSFKCNQRNDCLDGSDEKPDMCSSSQNASMCSLGKYACRNQNCIDADLVCNGQNDCRDNSDEYGCGVNECASPVLNKYSFFCLFNI